MSQQWIVNIFLPYAWWVVCFTTCVASLDKTLRHPMMQHSTAGRRRGLQHNISQPKGFNIPIYLSRRKDRKVNRAKRQIFHIPHTSWMDAIIRCQTRRPIKLIIMGWISADKGWITQELTPQYSQPAVILLAHKKLRCGGVLLFAWTWSPVIPISPHFWRWEPTLAGRGETGREAEWGGEEIVRGEIVALLHH